MRVLGWILPVVGGLLLLSAGAHAWLGWAQFGGELAKANVPADIVEGLSIGWHFGSVAMATFGVVLLFCNRDRRGGRPAGRAVAGTIAAAYVLFGVGAFVKSGANTHFLVGFVAPGVLLAIAVARASWSSATTAAASAAKEGERERA